MHTEPVREKLFTMRMSAEEWNRADMLARHHGITVAALVRMMLKDKERELRAQLIDEQVAIAERNDRIFRPKKRRPQK